MINLLPEEAIVHIRGIYLRRLISLTLLFLGILLLASIVFLTPSYFAAMAHLSQVQELLAAARTRPVSKQAESLAETARSINKRIEIVSMTEKSISLRVIIEDLLKYRKS